MRVSRSCARRVWCSRPASTWGAPWRWMRCAAEVFDGAPVDVAWYTTRERDGDEVLPWDHLDSGLDKQWLWDDWQDALGEFQQDDCRWTPCFDCGVCSNLGTDIQVGPTGRSLLPLLPK